jgi:hypothetical protein
VRALFDVRITLVNKARKNEVQNEAYRRVMRDFKNIKISDPKIASSSAQSIPKTAAEQKTVLVDLAAGILLFTEF